MQKYITVFLAAACASAMLAPAAQGKTMNTSWYQSGRLTASGMRFNPDNPHIAAHKSLAFGTRLLLRNPHNGKTLCVEIQDRGPFIKGRQLDITRGGKNRLGFGGRGVVALEYTKKHCSF